MNKEFIKEIKDTYRQEYKTLMKENRLMSFNEMPSGDFYRLEGWVEALEYVLKLAKTKGLDK